MSNLVGNPEDRFSQNEAHFIAVVCLFFINIFNSFTSVAVLFNSFYAGDFASFLSSAFSTKLHAAFFKNIFQASHQCVKLCGSKSGPAFFSLILQRLPAEARWPSGRATDSEARGRGFDPHSGRRVVSLSKIRLPPKRTGNTQEAVAPSRRN